jgi:hemolysin activation/secretion protein
MDRLGQAKPLAAIIAMALASPVMAQTAPVPGAPTREQIQPPPERPAPAPRPRLDSRDSFAAAPCPLSESPLRVAIGQVRYTPLGRAELPPEINAILAKVPLAQTGDQPIANVCAIRDAANAALRRAGYIASVQIPPQEITDGTLQLAVVLARITEVRVRGEPGAQRGLLEERIARLKALDPLNEGAIETLLLLAGDIPGLDVQLSLRPAGTGPGEVIGDLTVTSTRYTVYANAQNYGSRQLGRETGYVRGEMYGLLTGADTLFVAGSSTLDFDEQKVVQAGYSTMIDSAGTTVGTRATYAWSRPDLDTLDLRSRSLIAGIDVSRPLLRSVKANLTLAGGFEIVEQRTKVYGGAKPSPLNTDQVRALYLRAEGDARFSGPRGGDLLAISGNVELRQGIAILGASRKGQAEANGATLSRFDGDPQATVIRAAADADLTLGPIFSLAGAMRGQWTDSSLLNLDEFAIGNLSIGRGYSPGANAGDRAIGLRGEARARLPLNLPVAVRLLGFYDAVWLGNLDANTTEDKRFLNSWGGGVEVLLPGRASLSILYAKPLKAALSFDDKPPPDRLLISLTTRFGRHAR